MIPVSPFTYFRQVIIALNTGGKTCKCFYDIRRSIASPYVIEALTGLSARIKGYYHLSNIRERRNRDHMFEVREDVIADLLSCGAITESQKAWAARLGLSYRTLKLILAQLREEGVIEANTGRGRFAQSTYSLSIAYLESVQTDGFLEAAAGAESLNISGGLKGHTAISPLQGCRAFRRKGFRRVCGAVKVRPVGEHRSNLDGDGTDPGG